MHFVDRGDEPDSLAAVRRQYTARWVDYYKLKKGAKPSDTRWRSFEPILRDRFRSLCGYCEETSKGEVDHFRPKCTFPQLVYRWTNWIYACHVCNNLKGEEWTAGGYINPCDATLARRPETFFDFDARTGEILPRKELSGAKSRRAIAMRDDLQLNAYFRLKARIWYLKVVERALQAPGSRAEKDAFIADITAREARFSSLVRAFLSERGIPFPA